MPRMLSAPFYHLPVDAFVAFNLPKNTWKMVRKLNLHKCFFALAQRHLFRVFLFTFLASCFPFILH